MQIDAEQIWKFVNLFGLPLLLVVAFIKGWIVPGFIYEQVRVSEREFKELAYRGTELSKRMDESARVLAAETAARLSSTQGPEVR
jgi:uncharacterized membrane protein YciS (DUF1049 family)